MNSTYILDLSANTWSTGPEMEIARYYHTCNLIERCGRKEIVVVGADTYDLRKNLGFFENPLLPLVNVTLATYKYYIVLMFAFGTIALPLTADVI